MEVEKSAFDATITDFFHKAELKLPKRIASLSKPPAVDYSSALPKSSDEARELLVKQRVGVPGYRPPEKKLRHKWSAARLKVKSDKTKWTFTKHEVAKAFDSLLCRPTLPSPGIAQEVLNHSPASSLDELWCHFRDSKLEKSTRSLFRPSRPPTTTKTPWLNYVTGKDSFQYIRLMCHFGVSQGVLDAAFRLAMSKNSMDTMKMLLSYGAVASTFKDSIRKRFRLDDVALAKLLLSAPNAMSLEDWGYCVESLAESSPTILVLCLAHHPNIASAPMLFRALKTENVDATAIILAHAASDENFRQYRVEACRLASNISVHGNRCKVFEMLDEIEWVADTGFLRQELLKDCKLRQLDLVRILTDAGVILDVEPNNALSWAISVMDLEILQLFTNGHLSSSVLKAVPQSTSEEDMLQLLNIFGHRLGPPDELLHSHLINATHKQYGQLVRALVAHGASIEFQDASSVRTAIAKENFEVLGTLLSSECSKKALSSTIPTAMALKSRPNRLQAFKYLLLKGVLPQALGNPLFYLITEQGNVDFELIQLLLQYDAPVDGDSNDDKNCILAAARRGDLSSLVLLCNSRPQNETLSKAIPIAFEAIRDHPYDVALGMVKLLLHKGAAGEQIDETLLAAASQDSRLEFVRALLEHGAEANYRGGACFSVAVEKKSLKLLKMLCERSRPNQDSTKTALLKAIDPRWYNVEALELLLHSSLSSATALNSLLNSSRAFERFRDDPNVTTIIPCFLRHGLDVDINNGGLLSFAIQKENMILLKQILSANPSIQTLHTGFRAATLTPDRKNRFEMMELMLWQAESVEIGQSEMILPSTLAAMAGDATGLKLLLRHRANVDFDNGRGIQVAATAGALEVLDLLLACRPSSSSINTACLTVTSSSLIGQQREEAYERLLSANGGASMQDMSTLLDQAVASRADFSLLLKLLLSRGAEVKSETLKTALEMCPCSMYESLISNIKSANEAVEVFRHVRKAHIASNERYEIYKGLLNHRMPNEELSSALVDSVSSPGTNLDLPKLLLSHGASVRYEGGKVFFMALSRGRSVEAFMFLTQYIHDDKTAGVAFDVARKNALDNVRRKAEIYRNLLQWNIDQSSLQEALEDFLKRGHSDNSLVQLLLRKGADPNKNNARCFILACVAKREPEFRALSRHAKLAVVLGGLLAHFTVEGHVVRWFNMCLEERPPEAEIDQDSLLFRCLYQFPKGMAVLKLLLDNGVSASPTMPHEICSGQQFEECTALVWALFSSKPRVENDAILALLERGGGAARPTYSTPVTGVSAAFGCLLDKSRTPILKALLDLNREAILSYEIPASSFGVLAASSDVSDEDLSDLPESISLYLACLYLGNYEAFRLVAGKNTPDDGSLHTAAFFALPKFVKWLLKTHDPNYREEEFDQRIPLAVVCDAKPIPWSKIADEESSFHARQKMTMQLLAPGSSSKWRYRGKTVLHIALENGVETTKSIMEALKVGSDKEKYEKYRYTDREGNEYTPHEYVMEFVDVDEREKRALIKCLVDGGFGMGEVRDTDDFVIRPESAASSRPGGRRVSSAKRVENKRDLERRISALHLV